MSQLRSTYFERVQTVDGLDSLHGKRLQRVVRERQNLNVAAVLKNLPVQACDAVVVQVKPLQGQKSVLSVAVDPLKAQYKTRHSHSTSRTAKAFGWRFSMRLWLKISFSR